VLNIYIYTHTPRCQVVHYYYFGCDNNQLPLVYCVCACLIACVCALGLAEERCPDEIEIRHHSRGKKIVIMIIHKRTHVFRTVQRKGRMPVCLSVCPLFVKPTIVWDRSNIICTWRIYTYEYTHKNVVTSTSGARLRPRERERERVRESERALLLLFKSRWIKIETNI